MKKIFFLIPVFNDWESLETLIENIHKEIKSINNFEFNCIIINDSSTIQMGNVSKPQTFKNFKILDLKKNIGHARCIASGLRYLVNNEKFDFVILMDGDGEDRPEEIKYLISKATSLDNSSVVAKRVKRSEGFIFKLLYETHKILTFLTTGKKIFFGNYSCLTFKDAKILIEKKTTWSSYSGSVTKNLSNLVEIDSIRGLRYFGPSKMSLIKLVIHSLAIMASFKESVFFRSSLLIMISYFLRELIGPFWLLISIFSLIFMLLVFLVSLREDHLSLINSETNIAQIKSL
tara:strand:+ start:355 stop:1221 length:867 start_codon:yes stop_codon:yes gene_type:complete